MALSDRESPNVRFEVTPDGWSVSQASYFRIANHTPPRPWGYLDQVAEDVRSWMVLALWASGAIFLVIAFCTELRFFLVPGVMVFVGYFRICRNAVLHVRNAEVARGVIDKLGPHPLFKSSATATATTTDGRQVPVVVIERTLVREIMSDGGRAEVMFLDDRRSQFSIVIAARAAGPA